MQSDEALITEARELSKFYDEDSSINKTLNKLADRLEAIEKERSDASAQG